jgi:hypothetical protein
MKLRGQIEKGDLDKMSYEGLILETKTEIGDYRMITKDVLEKMMPLMNLIYSHEKALKERHGEEFRREDSDSFAILNLVLEKTEGLSEEERKGFCNGLADKYLGTPAHVVRVRPHASRAGQVPSSSGCCSIQ